MSEVRLSDEEIKIRLQAKLDFIRELYHYLDKRYSDIKKSIEDIEKHTAGERR